MLSDYGIENAGTKIEDKEQDLIKIECPFIAHKSGDFVVVYKIDPEKVHYLWNGKKIILSISEFIKSWSGVILLPEKTPESIEPGYKEHRKKELLIIAQKTILFLAISLIFGLAYINQSSPPSIIQLFNYSIILLLNLAGAYISYAIVLKQMHISSRYTDKICTLFSKSDCNNILESDAAKLWGVFGWSEIGLGYFSANVLLLLFAPNTLSVLNILALLNILCLPYTIWSVWYQKTKARQWCPLCLIVQVLLWGIFIANCLSGVIRIPDFDIITFQNILITGSLLAILTFLLNLLIPNLSRGREIEKTKQEINSIKANEDVFRVILSQQPFYEVSKFDSQIFFGNPDAQLKITIFTNPYCNPCARMHKKVIKLLHDTKRNICVQYIFGSFGSEWDFANKNLIAAYLQKTQTEFERIISEWFEKGKPLKEAFFSDLQLDINSMKVEIENYNHEEWKEKTKLAATPTVLVNGYKLPDNYKIEDLRYFAELEFVPPASLQAERNNLEFNVDVK